MHNSQTLKALELKNFSSRRLGHYPAFIEAALLVKKAAAVANVKTGAITQEECIAIFSACEQASQEDFVVEPLIGGGGIAVHQNINEVLANYSGLSKEVINRSQSTSDVGHTALRIAILQSFKKSDAINTLYEKIVREWQDRQMTARTCLRNAGKTSLGTFFSGHAELFLRRTQELEQAIQSLTVNLGGTVFGSGMGASTEYQALVFEELRKNSDLPLKLSPNLYDSAQNSDDLAAISNAFSLFAKAAIKVSQDLRLLFSEGFHEINLKPVLQGSSFFANKSNPILPETLIQASLLMLGKDLAIQQAHMQSELNLNVYDFFMGFLVLDQIELHEKLLGFWKQTLESMELPNAST